MSKVINFFSTQTDILSLLSGLQSIRSIHYVEAGVQDQPQPITYDSAYEIPNLGKSIDKGINFTQVFLAVDIELPFKVRSISLEREKRYSIDQKGNPDAVALFPGGQLDDQTILAGSIGTATDSLRSNELLSIIDQLICKDWSAIKSYAVSPGAVNILDNGGRLTANIRSPIDYDLRR